MPKTTLDGTKKKKQKLGKKKLAPTNATSTVFKSKSIVLLEQDVFRSDKGPVTKRQLTFRELTTQLRHYSANVRGDAVRGMNEILRDHPALLEMHAAELITALVPLLTDTEQAVRRDDCALHGDSAAARSDGSAGGARGRSETPHPGIDGTSLPRHPRRCP